MQHEICEMFVDEITTKHFVCRFCSKKKGHLYENLRAKYLPQSKLSEFLENWLNQFVATKNIAPITIRVLSDSVKSVYIKPGMKQIFSASIQFPYRSKVIFAFQEIDGYNVCFFALYTQEYGTDCAAPNTGRINIAYIDSVKHFQPSNFRTEIYHEILLAYLDYTKNLGFIKAHIWAASPCAGDEYIFHSRPLSQINLSQVNLKGWYKKLLEKGIEKRVLLKFNNLCDQTKHEKISLTKNVPYFAGDFWPFAIEEQINAFKGHIPKNWPQNIEAKISVMMKKLKNTFIVVHLNGSATIKGVSYCKYVLQL